MVVPRMKIGLFTKIFCRHQYEFIHDMYEDPRNKYRGIMRTYRCNKCGKTKIELIHECLPCKGGNHEN